jgi:hypothetical protein
MAGQVAEAHHTPQQRITMRGFRREYSVETAQRRFVLALRVPAVRERKRDRDRFGKRFMRRRKERRGLFNVSNGAHRELALSLEKERVSPPGILRSKLRQSGRFQAAQRESEAY